MRLAIPLFAALALLQARPVLAGEVGFEPLPPLDMEGVDPALAAHVFGKWTIRDESGEKTCRVELLKDTGIGGMQIDVDAACGAVFPVMDDIAAWRLLEGWAIELVDAERKARIRFTTPDDRYVAFPETDGIFTIAPEEAG